MKINFFFFAILFSCFYAFCQNPEPPGYEIPNYAPKSPEAAAFLKYGEYPVNLSTGVPNISIPIYTVEIPGYKLPITLDYHASGIKVNQEASWVGLGWNLNFGAQIILSVRDDVDENNSRIDDLPIDAHLNEYYLDHPYAFNSGTILSEELDKSRVKDSYHFSSPTASGEFYIEDVTTNKIVVYPPDAFKVEAISGVFDQPGGGRSRFKITDAAGNVYIFRTSETSIKLNYGQTYNQGTYKSAWYVDEIRTPTNDTIFFTYEDDGTIEEKNFSQRVDVKEEREFCNCTGIPSPYSHTVGTIVSMLNRTYTDVKKIKEITFNNGNSKVVFNRTDGREDLKNGFTTFFNKQHSTSKLSLIEVRHRNNTNNQIFDFVKGFELRYDYFNPGVGIQPDTKRLKLIKLLTLPQEDTHEFVYSDINLPPKGSFSQDYFGYFNGASNSDLIPEHHITDPNPTTIGSANRNVNETKVQAGILREIHYPSKGWTKFNYESNRYYGSTTSPSPVTVSVGSGQYHEDFNYDPNPEYDYLSFSSNFTVNTPTTALLSWQAQNNLTPQGQSHLLYHPEQYVRLKIYSSDGEVKYDSGNRNGSLYATGIEDYSSGLFLEPGSYTILIMCYGRNVKMNGTLNYTHSATVNDNFLASGLRIGSIENYDYDNTLLTKKAYEYTLPDDTSKSSGNLIGTHLFEFTSSTTKSFVCGTCPNTTEGSTALIPYLHYVIQYSISSNSINGMEGNTVAYQYVKEKSIDVTDESVNGYTLYKFTTEGDIVINPFTIITTPHKRGKIVEKSEHKLIDATDYLLRKEVNTYVEDNSKVTFIKGFKMQRFATINYLDEHEDPLVKPQHLDLTDCGGPPGNVLSSVSFQKFNVAVPWYYLKSTEVTEYFYDSANTLTGTLVTNKTYNYNNPDHLQLSSESMTTSMGETLETRYYYPGDAQCATYPHVNDLIDRNMISAPLISETFRGVEKLQGQYTFYKDWDTNAADVVKVLMPEIVKTAKGTDAPEARLSYNKIDPSNGNVLELQQESGMPTSYIWGYDGIYPIAKLENVSYDLIPANLISALQVAVASGVEQDIATAASDLRGALSEAMVTVFTYKPLFGVTSVTDPRGYKMSYEYDSQGRLVRVRDAQGNILSENEYRFKN